MPKSYWDVKTCYQLYLLFFLFPLAFHSLCLPFQKPLLCPGVRAPARSPSDFQVKVSMSFSPLFLFPPKLSFEILSFHFLAQTGSQTPNCMFFYWFVVRVFTQAGFHIQWSSWLPLEYLLLSLSPWGACVSHYVHSRFMAREKSAERGTGNSNNWQPSICPALISRK